VARTRQDTSKDAEEGGFPISNLKDDGNHTPIASSKGWPALQWRELSGWHLPLLSQGFPSGLPPLHHFHMISHHYNLVIKESWNGLSWIYPFPSQLPYLTTRCMENWPACQT